MKFNAGADNTFVNRRPGLSRVFNRDGNKRLAGQSRKLYEEPAGHRYKLRLSRIAWVESLNHSIGTAKTWLCKFRLYLHVDKLIRNELDANGKFLTPDSQRLRDFDEALIALCFIIVNVLVRPDDASLADAVFSYLDKRHVYGLCGGQLI